MTRSRSSCASAAWALNSPAFQFWQEKKPILTVSFESDGWCRPEPADPALLALGEKAVEVLLARLEPLDPVMDGVVAALLGAHLRRFDHLFELLVGRDLDGELRGAIDFGEPCPDRDRLRRRKARGDAVRELAAGRERNAPLARQRRVVDRTNERQPRGRPSNEELPPAKSDSLGQGSEPYTLREGPAPPNDESSRCRRFIRVARGTSKKPVLLAGGNPQIAKGYGDAPVQAYIAAMPEWKSDVGRRLDAIIVRAVPGVRKAVKWNSPLYGPRARATGSSAFTASRGTSRWRSSAARRCDPSRPASPSRGNAIPRHPRGRRDRRNAARRLGGASQPIARRAN